ncbi:MAG: CoA pyrophosphatase [Deltaproteobacteria bacterium]|nr:CoA pyrophosphatase [Deltaproteobacteria bacterium]
MTVKRDFGKTIKGILRYRLPRHIPNGNLHYTPAAVLVPIFRMNDEYHFLFTKRAPKVAYHRGHVSFPGGVVNESDRGPEDTALREAEEEIGLLREDVEMLGPIDDSLTFVPPFIVHPFVGLIPHPYSFNINPREVEKTIVVPLGFFASQVLTEDATPEEFERGIGFPEYRYHGEMIWGTTAGIVANFLGILKEDCLKGACP